jgi:DNA-binding transcriptional MocR family regulator
MGDWRPDIGERPGPRYIAIADALAEDIGSGILRPGDRLPTHRALARRLGINVGTVTRAYTEAERRGHAAGEVGRGTFVRTGADGLAAARPAAARRAVERRTAERRAPGSHAGANFAIEARLSGGVLDLAVNRPVAGPQAGELSLALAELAKGDALNELLSYAPAAGSPGHCAAGADWIGRRGVAAAAGQVTVTAGGQHGLLAALAALAGPGDIVLTETLTYPGLRAVANFLHLKLEGVLMDEQGMLPESLELACWSSGARVLYCMPTLHNPTTAVMSEARRRDILEVAARYDLTILEDDVYGDLHPGAPPPLAARAPDRCVYLTSLAKVIAPGLRVGYVLAPAALTDSIGGGVRTTAWMATPLMAEIAARWIGDGTAARLLDWQRQEADGRRLLAGGLLDGFAFAAQPGGLHIWLKLPDPWRAGDLTSQARAKGVGLSPADVFAAGRSAAPQAVRISLGATADAGELRHGIEIVADILGAPPNPRLPVA